MVAGNRFDRCLTPMGTVPISVIYGFNYPVDQKKGNSSNIPRRGAEVIPVTKPSQKSSAWPSSLSSRQTLHTQEIYRARTEVDFIIKIIDKMPF